MTFIFAIGDGWGQRHGTATETFVVPALPAGSFFWAVDFSTASTNNIKVYSGTTLLVDQRAVFSTFGGRGCGLSGKNYHSGGDLKIVITVDPAEPFNQYGVGWAHAELDTNPAHWRYQDRYLDTQSFGEQSLGGFVSRSANATYGPGVPSSPTGGIAPYPIDQAEENTVFQKAIASGTAGSIKYLGHNVRTTPNTFMYQRQTEHEVVQSAVSFFVRDHRGPDSKWSAVYQAGTTRLEWGGIQLGSIIEKTPILRISATASVKTKEALGYLNVRALSIYNRVAYTTARPLPTNSWIYLEQSGKDGFAAGWQDPGGDIVATAPFISETITDPNQPRTVTDVPFDSYMLYALDSVDPNTTVKFLSLTLTSSNMDAKVMPVISKNADADQTTSAVWTTSNLADAGVTLIVVTDMPPAKYFKGFPVLLGTLKLYVEDPAYPGDIFWTNIGKGDGYTVLKMPYSGSFSEEAPFRTEGYAANPFYIYTAEGWRLASLMIPRGGPVPVGSYVEVDPASPSEPDTTSPIAPDPTPPPDPEPTPVAPPVEPPPGPRDGWVTGTYKPMGGSTAGALSGTTRTVTVGGTLTFSIAGEKVNNVRFERYVTVKAANVTFTNCEFIGPVAVPTNASRGLLNANAGINGKTKVVDSTFRAQSPAPGIAGVTGSGFHLLRCDMVGLNDGADFFDDNCIVEACHIRELAYYSPSFTNSNNATHNDCIQIHGGHNHLIFGNNLEAWYGTSSRYSQVYNGQTKIMSLEPAVVSSTGSHLAGNNHYPALQATSGIMYNSITSTPYDVDVLNNWFSGGSFGVNMNVPSTTAGTMGRIEHNRFARNQRHAGYGFARRAGLILDSYSDNLWEDDLTSVPIRNA